VAIKDQYRMSVINFIGSRCQPISVLHRPGFVLNPLLQQTKGNTRKWRAGGLAHRTEVEALAQGNTFLRK
jgi:hypothetical protein